MLISLSISPNMTQNSSWFWPGDSSRLGMFWLKIICRSRISHVFPFLSVTFHVKSRSIWGLVNMVVSSCSAIYRSIQIVVHVTSPLPSSKVTFVLSSFAKQNTGGATVMRRSVTLTATGVPQTGGVSAAGGGLTVLATASGARPGSVIYHHHPQGSTGPGTPTGITLLPTATAQGLPQIIRPRQQVSP